MAFRIGHYVVGGFLSNRKRNQVLAWLAFDDERGLKLELTGNLVGDLAGCEFEFTVDRDPQPIMDDETFDSLQVMQIGAPGDCMLRMVRHADVDAETLLQLGRQGTPPDFREVPCLYIEWFSQNGRMVAEIIEPIITQMDSDSKDENGDASPLSDTDELRDSIPQYMGFEQNEDGEFSESDISGAFASDTDEGDEQQDDPYGLFDPGLTDHLRRSITQNEAGLSGENEGDDSGLNYDDEMDSDSRSNKSERRSWDEVLPGIDPATKAMYEQWDEVVYGERDEPLSTLFDPPISLPPVSQVTTEEEATALVQTLIIRLALLGVAIDVCEHYSMLDLYEYILTNVISSAEIHPQLSATGWVQHFSISENCPLCNDEFKSNDEMEN